MPGHYYVWYRMTGDPRAAAAAVAALVAEVTQRTGINGRLLRRRDDARVWMEVYENVTDPAAFDQAFAAATRAHEPGRFAAGGVRHVEAFVALEA
jgi:hypothetical protein